MSTASKDQRSWEKKRRKKKAFLVINSPATVLLSCLLSKQRNELIVREELLQSKLMLGYFNEILTLRYKIFYLRFDTLSVNILVELVLLFFRDPVHVRQDMEK